MIAEIASTADPWIGLVAVGAVMLGLVALLRGPAALVTAGALGVIGSIAFRAHLAGETQVTNELNAGTFLIGLGVASLLVVFIWPKRA